MPDKRNIADIDSLTQLGNREYFTRKLTELTANGLGFSIAVIDIDHFKSVNDGFGHHRGDIILSEFGKRALGASREGDMLFRYGGDEFTALLPGADTKEAESFAARLLSECSGREFEGNPPLSITLSIGVSVFPDDGHSARELFDVADRRLYSAKREGRNRVVSSDDALQNEDSGVKDGRILGRDRELSHFVSFTQEAAEKGRGFFLVLGPDGSGKGCFMEAASSFLSLGDYKLLTVSGGDTQTPFSALAEVLTCAPEKKAVVDALYAYAGSSMSLGIFLKDMHAIDRSSIEALMEFYAMYPGWMIVTASTERTSLLDGGGFGGISSSVRLGPVSLEDCRAWFRSGLMWNPPEDFLEWFHGETGGLPGLFIQGIHHLERRGYLSCSKGSYSLEEDYRDFPLGARMAFGTSAEINNLPVDLSPFVGRTRELEEIRKLLDEGTRLITLRGMSGMGCRRLAIRVAGQNEFMFPSGICMVDCSSEGTPVPVRLASELSLPSGRRAAETISGFIEESRMLLVFTNVKPGDEAVSFISELLSSCSGITVITTSRTALDLHGESIVQVAGISTERPDSGGPSPAAGIFIQTAERLGGIRFTGNLNLKLVEEICSLLSGAPLAIELAASWTRVMSVAAICRRIRANPAFLGGTNREKTIEGLSELFQESWDQLSAVERNALSRLTVFAGHFTVQEAEEISDVSPEMLLSLVDRSFLLRDDMGIHIPAMTRDFIIQEKNPFSRGFEVAREMHCRHFASRTSAYGEMAYTGLEAGRGLDGIKTSFDDITLAWKLAVEKNRFRFLRQMLKPVFVYCLDRGRFRTGYNMMEEALRDSSVPLPEGLASVLMASQSLLALRTGRMTVSGKLISKALETGQGMFDCDRARVLFTRGSILVETGNLSGAGNYLEEAIAMYNSSGCPVEGLEAELELVNYNLQSGNYSAARRMIPGIAGRCREISYRCGEWKTRLYMGRLAASEGDFRRARDAFLAYLSAVKTAGYTGRCAYALNQLAEIEASQGSFGEAEQHYMTAADYFRRIGSIRGQAGIKMNLALLSRKRGSSEDVRKNYGEALALGEKAHDENIISGSLNGLAYYYLEEGDLDRGESFLVRAAETSSRSGNKPVLVKTVCGFARLDLLKGNPERAARTVIALLHEPASDAESEGMCLELLREIRNRIGGKAVDRERQNAVDLTLFDLADSYLEGSVSQEDTLYRKG